MDEIEGRERRLFERLEYTSRVNFIDYNKHFTGSANAVDISAQGMGMVSPKFFPFGQKLTLWAFYPDGKSSLQFEGEVRWSKRQEDGDWRVGLNFLNNASSLAIAGLRSAVN